MKTKKFNKKNITKKKDQKENDVQRSKLIIF